MDFLEKYIIEYKIEYPNRGTKSFDEVTYSVEQLHNALYYLFYSNANEALLSEEYAGKIIDLKIYSVVENEEQMTWFADNENKIRDEAKEKAIEMAEKSKEESHERKLNMFYKLKEELGL